MRASQVGLQAEMGINNMSVIRPDDTNDFISAGEHDAIFGSGNIGPDRIRVSMTNIRKASIAAGMPPPSEELIGGHMEAYEQYNGEFRIEKGFFKLD